jgi:uroporphyrinogen III methyltransferase/synthase
LLLLIPRLPVEIIPGITSPFAAAAELAIPLTHKTLSTTLVLTTGHDPSLLDFDSLAKMDTLAIVMATRTLETIVDALMEAGLAGSTPVCIVKRTSFPDQQAIVSTLETVVQDTEGKKLSPAVLFVGQVAQFADEKCHATI